MDTLAIGDTGAQLVSKFNGNFGLLPPVFNVESYGAVHDGVTNDTEAIQDAINACFLAGGGSVFFPNGVYVLAGDLLGTVDGIAYNSQLYIPDYNAYEVGIPEVRLIGESMNWMGFYGNVGSGVVLRSTIAGTGTYPAILRSKSTGVYSMNYTGLRIENISFRVAPFSDTTGVSMCGLDLLYHASPYINNVSTGIWSTSATPKTDNKEPENEVFGLAIGIKQNDFPRIGFYVSIFGFTYGLVMGEGVHINNYQSYGNKYALFAISNNYGGMIDYMTANWNTYLIKGQDGTYFGQTYSTPSRIIINNLASESGNAENGIPEWLWEVDKIHDPYHTVYGHANYMRSIVGADFDKAHGGFNFHFRNIGVANNQYTWTTATRPTADQPGITGFNRTTGKLECWDGDAWQVAW